MGSGLRDDQQRPMAGSASACRQTRGDRIHLDGALGNGHDELEGGFVVELDGVGARSPVGGSRGGLVLIDEAVAAGELMTLSGT